VLGTVQTKLPVLGTESAMVRMGTTFVLGPRRSWREILSVLGVVGVQVIVKVFPAGINSPSPGWPIGLPSGGLAVLAGVRAEAVAARARSEVKIEESIVSRTTAIFGDLRGMWCN